MRVILVKKLIGCICYTILCLPGVVAYGEQEPEPANHDALSLDRGTLEEELVAPVAAEELLEADEGINRERLRSQTALLGGMCVVTAVGLYVMPSSITGWDHDAEISKLPEQWWDNVSRRPIWDSDRFFFNYIAHPYVGGVYYQMARKSGYGQGGSLLYSALMSTFFWEYGVEAFAERPSIQDLFITPLAGWAVGEWFHRTEKKIIANQNRFMGSEIIGEIALFFIDPMSRIGNGVNRLVGKEWVLTGSLAPHSPYASDALRGDHPDGVRSHSPMLTLALQRQF